VKLTKNQYRIGTGLYLLIILAASSIPGNSLPKLVILSPDKLLHIVEYGILGFLTYKSFYSVSLPIIVGSLLFAGLDEIWQSFIPGRMSSIYDVIADIIGFTIVLGTMYYFSRKRSTSTPHG
tara:strand:- start:105 stop:470 length:366 start_codon:yes stop_codon:yes gene_type:complete